MKQSLIKLSRQYVAALRKYLQQGPRTTLQPALKLGRHALVLGVETMDLARMHRRAVVILKLTDRRNRLTRRAGIFLTEALVPLVGKHRPSGTQKNFPGRQREVMERGGVMVAAANLQLKRSVVRHKGLEAGLKKRDHECARLLKGALPAQKSLRQLTHRILLAQEKERRKISHQLQDEIGQTLLSINVRLLNLRTAARGNKTSLMKEVASARRLVGESIKSINRFARELDRQQPA